MKKQFKILKKTQNTLITLLLMTVLQIIPEKFVKEMVFTLLICLSIWELEVQFRLDISTVSVMDMIWQSR